MRDLLVIGVGMFVSGFCGGRAYEIFRQLWRIRRQARAEWRALSSPEMETLRQSLARVGAEAEARLIAGGQWRNELEARAEIASRVRDARDRGEHRGA